MGYVVGFFTILAIYACWQFFWKDAAFAPYLVTLNPKYGAWARVGYFAIAILLALGGVFGLFLPLLSILLNVFVASLWITSPNGRAWVKKALGLAP
jgi:hypothetical protein